MHPLLIRKVLVIFSHFAGVAKFGATFDFRAASQLGTHQQVKPTSQSGSITCVAITWADFLALADSVGVSCVYLPDGQWQAGRPRRLEGTRKMHFYT
jgi:hypothetical protein